MKKLLPALALTLLLAACGSQTTRFTLLFDTSDAARRTLLTDAVLRMVEGRLSAKKKELVSKTITPEGDSATLEVTVPDEESATFLKESLVAPFTMSIMKQVDAGQGDIISEKFGEFKETGIVTKHIDWVKSGSAKVAGEERGVAVIEFTKEGQTLLKDMFAKNRGSVIGIFVREQLMSKKLIDTTDKQTSIAIEGIPNAALAAAFADDVNTGLHVKFMPTP